MYCYSLSKTYYSHFHFTWLHINYLINKMNNNFMLQKKTYEPIKIIFYISQLINTHNQHL